MDPSIDPDEDEPLLPAMRAVTRPKPLFEGARIRVIAPSGTFGRERFDAGIARLRDRYEVVFDRSIFDRAGYLAGSDARRAGELVAALEDPLCEAIVCARGGYGAMRILPLVPASLVARNPKLLVGFSDITALHVLWQRAKVASLHASMACSLGSLDDEAFGRWCATLEGSVPDSIEGESLAPGVAEGIIAGGNLSLLHALEGTPFSANAASKILVLEDVAEAPYRIDRMLTTLRLSGFFDGVRGIVLGAFTKSTPGPDGTTAEDVLRERLAPLEVPILRAATFGHLDSPIEIPLGVEATLECGPGRGRLRFTEAATQHP